MLAVNYFLFTSAYQRYVFSEYVCSLIASIFNENATDIFIQPSGLKSLVKYSDILHSTLVKTVVRDFYDRLSIAVMVSFALSIVGYFAISRWLKVRGKKHTDDVQIKGDSLVTKKELSTLLVKEKSDSDLKLAGLPLVKNKEPLVNKAKEIYGALKQNFMVFYDEAGAIGRRYRRQDEIGTPQCITVDFQTLEDDTVTVRDRDTMKQERVKIDEL